MSVGVGSRDASMESAIAVMWGGSFETLGACCADGSPDSKAMRAGALPRDLAKVSISDLRASAVHLTQNFLPSRVAW
jgi:hypothetical protein